MEQKYKSRKGMAEHRLVIEEYFERKLKSNEHVHHINGDKRDNRLENLVVMSAQAHMYIHKHKHKYYKKCCVCHKTYKPTPTKRKRSKTCSFSCKRKLDTLNASKRKRKIKQFSKNNEFIKEWGSARDIQNELNVAESNINKCCNGNIKSAYGYIWKYSNYEEKDAIVKELK